MSEQHDGNEGHSGIRVIPPFILVPALLIALVLDWIWPSRVGLPDALRWLIGFCLLVSPFLFLPSIVAAFRRAQTGFDVRQVPQSLVTEGLYRYSRNPIYVLLIAFTAGVGLIINNPWIFLTLVPAIAFLHVAVVLPEEAVLENRFGQDYLDYKRRVRRWI